MNRTTPLFLLCLTVSLPVSAETIYTWVDQNGVKHFSTKPPQGSDKQKVMGDVRHGEVKIDKFYSMQKYQAPQSEKPKKEKPAKAYSGFAE